MLGFGRSFSRGCRAGGAKRGGPRRGLRAVAVAARREAHAAGGQQALQCTTCLHTQLPARHRCTSTASVNVVHAVRCGPDCHKHIALPQRQPDSLQAAAATKSAVDAELEALQAFGTRQYAARALQVTSATMSHLPHSCMQGCVAARQNSAFVVRAFSKS